METFAFRIAPEPPREERQAAERFFARRFEFLKGVVEIGGLPCDERVEVCFAGRSNVGKSSLLNALGRRKGLARTSSTPGRTQELNFFTLGESHYLVDLPGYGYAQAPKHLVGRWQNLLINYLRGRAGLRRAFVLIDIRHGAKPIDLEMLGMLNEAALSFQVVLTKADKIKPDEVAGRVAQCGKALSGFAAAHPEMIVTSASKHIGLDALRDAIYQLGRG